MNRELTLRTRLLFTGIVTLLIWAHLAWDNFNGGVPTHYILQSGDLPGISNWWGGFALPLLTWLLLYRIKQKVNNDTVSDGVDSLRKIIYRFILALMFGVALSIFFTIGTNVTDYMMVGLFLLAFFIPIYKDEYLLGFVIGTAYTFGVIIPTVFGTVLIILFALIYKSTQAITVYLKSKFK